MLGLNIVSFVFIVVGFLVVGARLLRELQLKQAEALKNQPQLFKQKFIQLKKQEYEKHVIALMLTSLLLLLGLVFLTSRLLRMEDQYGLLQQQQVKLNADFKNIKEEKMNLLVNLPITTYPKDGLGLVDMKWDVLKEGENKKALIELEALLNQQLMPYFGMTTSLIVFDTPSQSLHLNFIFDHQKKVQLQQAEENVTALITEFNQISVIQQVNLQLKNSEEKQKDQSYYYVREANEGQLVELEALSSVEVEQDKESKEEKSKDKDSKDQSKGSKETLKENEKQPENTVKKEQKGAVKHSE